jgi:hypothetical protein
MIQQMTTRRRVRFGGLVVVLGAREDRFSFVLNRG